MFLKRNQKGYGWYAKIVSKDMNTNAERTGYLNFRFKKGCEPAQSELNDKESYNGEFYFHDNNGGIRKVFPVVTEYNGNTKVEFMMLEKEEKQAVKVTKREQDNFGTTYSDIKDDDLPFY